MGGILSSGQNLIIFIVMLALLVFVHESGHFIVAKRLRIPVLEFGFGFPPRILRFWKNDGSIEIQGKHIIIPRQFKLPENLAVGSRVRYQTEVKDGRDYLTALQVLDEQDASIGSSVQQLDPGTEYTVNSIPLGGFVRMSGEEDPNVPGGFASAKPGVRAPILLAGVVMNFILAYLAFSIAAFASPPYVSIQTTNIVAVAPNSPAAEAGLRSGDTVAAVNGLDVRDNFPALSQTLRDNAGKPVALTIIRNGRSLDPITVVPRANPPAGQGALGIQLNGMVGLRVMSVQPGSIADQAGVRAGDVLVFIVDPTKNLPLKDQNQLAQYTAAHPGWKIEWHIQRNGKWLNPNPLVVQIPQDVTSQNATLGLNMQLSPLDAPRAGAEEMGTVFASIPAFFQQLGRGGAEPMGFVGIYQVTGEVAQRAGLLGLIDLVGLLSLNLAVVNLLPFPALDGGRLVFVILEWLRGGRRIDPAKEGLVHLVGFMVLIGLMLLITFFDVQRLISGIPILPSP